MRLLLLLPLLAAAANCGHVFTVLGDPGSAPGFWVDRENATFVLDGRPFRYMSGSIHYFRVHPKLWRDRLRKLRAAGFNAVQTYVEWSTHEPK